ncbi:MAG: hypothetical protein A2W18_12865 [Candidatus Muproteobacteria bacterium RBG_16_60_9]|uniref:Heme-binding protein n=1 Tax=Candidatus Muproteobacteria bacterium RBG_16_60_9 TaxID=1817755 RepID=A0A1F6V4L0_9PROT|nr:MAG: hypothetical protein A2W18_12865 [Candidatus Muproteobacteria bacterium RBG_16_60_9]
MSVRKSLNLTVAKQLAAAAEEEATKNKWNVVIALVDAGGHLIYLQRIDNTQHGSIDIAIQKAQTAAAFKRPTKAFEDGLASGRTGLLRLNVLPLEGGVPLIVGGEVVGAVGVSGLTSQQDGMVAKAAADALAKLAGG